MSTDMSLISHEAEIKLQSPGRESSLYSAARGCDLLVPHLHGNNARSYHIISYLSTYKDHALPIPRRPRLFLVNFVSIFLTSLSTFSTVYLFHLKY